MVNRTEKSNSLGNEIPSPFPLRLDSGGRFHNIISVKPFLHFLLSFLITTVATGQQRKDVSVPQDTATVRHIVLLDPGLSLGRAVLLLPPTEERDTMYIAPSFLFLKGPVPSEPFFGESVGAKADLVSPLRLQMEKESRLQTLQTVLGSVQLAGVSYLAYKQLKRAGLFK